MKNLLKIRLALLFSVVVCACNLLNDCSVDTSCGSAQHSRMAANNEVRQSYSFEGSTASAAEFHGNQESYRRDNFVLHQNRSLPMVLSETANCIVGVKAGKTSHHHSNTNLIRIGDSHSLNLFVEIRNTHILCFTRSVDKYIYALRRIII